MVNGDYIRPVLIQFSSLFTKQGSSEAPSIEARAEGGISSVFSWWRLSLSFSILLLGFFLGGYEADLSVPFLQKFAETHHCFCLLQAFAATIHYLSWKPLLSSSEWAEQSKELVDYLVNSCGFPSESARFVCARLGRRARILKAMKAIGFFREIGFTDAQIRKSLSRKPLLLATKVDETLKPKVRTFLDWGLSSHDIAHIVSRNPFILAINLRNRILPVVGLIRELLPQNDDAVRSIKALFSVPLFSTDTKEMMETNVAILRARGVPDRTLSRILRSWPRLLSWTPSSLEKMVARVHKMGFDYSSGLFPAALSTVAAMGDSVWEAKLEVFTEFGWSRENISTAFQKAPFLLVSSGNLLRKKLKFFMVELEITPSELAATPRLLLHNMDRRIVPRVMVLRFLIDKNLIRKRKHSLRAILLMKDEDFYNKFVLAHKDECPEMFEVYMKSSKVEISRKFG